MRTVIVRYKVKAQQAEENVRFVEAVFAELQQAAPAGLKYASFVAEDGLSFVHVACFAEGTKNPLPPMDSFQAFQAELLDRCEEGPDVIPMKNVGSFNFFD